MLTTTLPRRSRAREKFLSLQHPSFAVLLGDTRQLSLDPGLSRRRPAVFATDSGNYDLLFEKFVGRLDVKPGIAMGNTEFLSRSCQRSGFVDILYQGNFDRVDDNAFGDLYAQADERVSVRLQLLLPTPLEPRNDDITHRTVVEVVTSQHR